LRDAQDVGLVGREGAHAVDTGIDAPEQVSLLFRKGCSHVANLAVLVSLSDHVSCQEQIQGAVECRAQCIERVKAECAIGRDDNRCANANPSGPPAAPQAPLSCAKVSNSHSPALVSPTKL